MADIFGKLAQINARRTGDSPEEKLVLQAMRRSASGTGTVGELVQQLPTLEGVAIRNALASLAVRGKARTLPGNRWQLL